ncbi:hypothetical protein TPY_0436 [Sulfobacillus acidophilus TPY]|uniref:Uncharacterized protein n=1 Tax=Sulfobacillus acidophilus (strain ATCC 700253 / DSM 10332 / NAL) TaxID=679936 RepID=G8TY59_SULAD|nr:hypothetical protein TPY_0436 [Sulfobacillus acidophilus TPY]AEW03966.1 hypothetical protein Sulac_0400 [Sulfobacillus acidophilus DSM 10332]
MSIFSTYSQQENQITATLLAVLQELRFPVTEHILQTLVEESEADLVVFENQPQGTTSRPDARISGSFSYWFEVKRVPGAINLKQIETHLKGINKPPTGMNRLIVLTPDFVEPPGLNQYYDKGVVWNNFNALYDICQTLLEPEESVFRLTSNERYLLAEFAEFLVESNLVQHAEPTVVVVPARLAWDDYKQYHAYICQPNRTFRNATYMGFYRQKAIKRWIPQIVEHLTAVTLEEGTVESNRFRSLIDAIPPVVTFD